MISPYSSLAFFYDRLTENVGYEKRGAYLHSILKRNGVDKGILLDLACGTGTNTIYFAKLGYDLIGVDISPEMLMIAQNKITNHNLSALLLRQDITKLDLYGTVDAAICTLDSINHLSNIEDVKKAFSKVSLFLNKGGIFVFDVNTEFKHKNVLGNNTYVYDIDNIFCVWQNEYKEKDKSVKIQLDIFERTSTNYVRFTEYFSEKAFSINDLSEALDVNGFKILAIFDEMTENQVKQESERIYFVAKKI